MSKIIIYSLSVIILRIDWFISDKIPHFVPIYRDSIRNDNAILDLVSDYRADFFPSVCFALIVIKRYINNIDT